MSERGIVHHVRGRGGQRQVDAAQAARATGSRPPACAVRALREPGGTAVGEAVRAILLDPEHAGLDDTAEILLYEASRAQLVAEVIEPALEAGEVVLCDRFYDSTTAYQGYARGIAARATSPRSTAPRPAAWRPTARIVLDVDPALGIERATATAPTASRPRTSRSTSACATASSPSPPRSPTASASSTRPATSTQVAERGRRRARRPARACSDALGSRR